MLNNSKSTHMHNSNCFFKSVLYFVIHVIEEISDLGMGHNTKGYDGRPNLTFLLGNTKDHKKFAGLPNKTA